MKKKTEQTILSNKKTINVLSDKELATINGGATEELFGSYHFLLEVSGITPE